jgi:hypothetical protein
MGIVAAIRIPEAVFIALESALKNMKINGKAVPWVERICFPPRGIDLTRM